MASLYQSPTIRGYNQKRQHESTVDRFVRNVVSSYRCTTCGTPFVPLYSMGKRECRVHPQALNTSLAQSTSLQLQRWDYPSRALENHYGCCGGAHRPSDRHDFEHDSSLFARGCCLADHVQTTRWRDTSVAGFLGHTDVVQAFPTASSTSSHSFGARLSVANPSTTIFATPALASRIQIWPLRVVEKLYDMRVGRADALFSAGLQALPFKLSLTSFVKGREANIQEKVAEILGAHAVVFGEGDKERVLRPVRQERSVTLEVGTQRIVIDLRDAYISMCQAFNLPVDRLQQQILRDTGTRTTVAEALAREREMQARFRLMGGDLLSGPQARQILFDSDVLRMHHQELQQYTDTYLQQQAQASVAGEAGIYEDPDIHTFMMDIHPFVINSWIDPFVPPERYDDPMRGVTIHGDYGAS